MRRDIDTLKLIVEFCDEIADDIQRFGTDQRISRIARPTRYPYILNGTYWRVGKTPLIRPDS